ncbi:hypothetical protein FVQ98_16150 [Ottowia sp. GY511]|uniref:PfkB family carbohydrate kinase n=1 Tax=Ottowia flava TaxID=2675430 RepID=A0ABW4KUR2_9BURK|nr:PfkB family carbohydrate kinase [Ottowia sp. GY511]TXK24804.1 hypothetical protein FVQ98_16150 [Ottowia sp. GY511]
MNVPTAVALPRLFVVGSFVEAHCWFVAERPAADESQHANAYAREFGGKGLAVALGAHRLGVAVDLLIAAGEDAAGDALLALLLEEGVSSMHTHRLGQHSGRGCGLITAQGGTTVTVFAGANALLGGRELQLAEAALRSASVVYAQLEVPLALAQQVLRRARSTGALTVLNASPWPATALSGREESWAGLLAATCVLVLNQNEAVAALAELADRSEPEGGVTTLAALPPHVTDLVWRRWPGGQWLVITLGARGCVAYGADGSVVDVQGHLVDVRQPIGAGDAFSAGLCAALTAGEAMADALKLANACGALATSRDGILAALPRREEVLGLAAAAYSDDLSGRR